ncbi:hypothetical protein [Xanthomonas phaseoli]|uniref:hypothetical protein n=5 Tax=Xanthomonas phaseoli TaxID=1985254 RepID=UPI001330ACAF|nr:hypothetical protein [Xanthomonas phaseoli]
MARIQARKSAATTGLAHSPQDSCSVPDLGRDEVVDERWKRRFIWQLHVFTKEIGFCESFLHACRLNPVNPYTGQAGTVDPYKAQSTYRQPAPQPTFTPSDTVPANPYNSGY